MNPVPQPPIPNLPGLFFRKERQVCAVILDSIDKANASDLLPQGFRWSPMVDDDEILFARFTASALSTHRKSDTAKSCLSVFR
jgi:hypothetical protein